MTHEELLSEINFDLEDSPHDKYILALRVVVELCKPNEDDTYKMISSLDILEAIEKELG